MLTFDGSVATPAKPQSAPRAPKPAFVSGLPGADLLPQQATPAARVPVAAPVPDDAAPSLDNAGRMIFLRRANGPNGRYWLCRFMGVPELPEGELPPTVACDATLRDVLTWLQATYNGKLAGAWLIVAP